MGCLNVLSRPYDRLELVVTFDNVRVVARREPTRTSTRLLVAVADGSSVTSSFIPLESHS